jgi:hypothetical protein
MQTEMLRTLTMFAYVFHIGGGTIGLFSGTVAAFARKGGKLHRNAGKTFTVSMLAMGAFASYLAAVIPGQMGNFFGGVFTFYLVATAWMTVHRKAGTIGFPEKIALFAVLGLCVPFAIVIFQVATGRAPHVKGPFLIATYGVASVVAIAAITDARVVLAGGISGASRVARHLWRMCVALIFATGSFFTNALPRLLPGPMHVSSALFLPMLLPLGLLIFWMIRVRFTKWFGSAASEPRVATGNHALEQPV